VDGRNVHIGTFGTPVEAAVVYVWAVGQAPVAGEAGPSAAAAGEASDSGDGEPGGAGSEAAAAESSSDEEEEEAASTPLRAPSCKTLGCNLRLWHAGPCSTAVTGKRARVLTDKARAAKRGKGVGGGGGGGVGSGGGGGGDDGAQPSSSDAPSSAPDASVQREAAREGEDDEVEVDVEQEESEASEAEAEAMSEDDVEEVAPPLQSSAAAAPSLAGGDVQISAASGALKPPPSRLLSDALSLPLLVCTAQACCPSTYRTSVRSALSTHSMRPRGQSRRRSMATRRPAPTATASRATRPCPRAATGGAASRGCRRTATHTPAAPSGARSAPTPSGSALGRRGRRGTRSGWARDTLEYWWDTVVEDDVLACVWPAAARRRRLC